MSGAAIGWLNLAVMVVSSVGFSRLYVLSVRAARLEQRLGEAAYRRCAYYRVAASALMVVVVGNYVIYYHYPLPIDPLPARFSWPDSVNIVLAAILGLPSLILLVWGNVDAGKGPLYPDKTQALYGGIYEWMRHPQALGEVFLWLVIALLLDSPFLAAFSLLYVPIWYCWCVEEEKDLLLRYGDAYAEYRKRTGMFFPRRRRSRSAG